MNKSTRSAFDFLIRATPLRIKRRVAAHFAFEDIDRFRLLQEAPLLRRFFDEFKVDCVFDVGANTGQYANMLRNEVRFNGQIFSFEPTPELADSLDFLAKADLKWQVEKLALSDSEGLLPFFVTKSSQLNSLNRPNNQDTTWLSDVNVVEMKLEVRAERLATTWNRLRDKYEFSRPFLKIDTQGHDLNVINGAGECLSHFLGIQVELGFKRLYENAPRAVDIIDRLGREGFEPHALFPNNAGHFPELIEMDGIFVRSSLL